MADSTLTPGTKPTVSSNGNDDLGRDRWPNVTDGDWLRNLAQETFADHHSQRDTGNRLRQIASRCDADGYRDAFYVIADLLGLSAMPISPKEAFETVMLPRLRQLTGNETSELPSHEAIADQLSSMRPGSTKCPLCARTYVHQHTPEELIIYRNGVKHGLSLVGQADTEPRCPDCGLLLDPPGHDLNCPRRAQKAETDDERADRTHDSVKTRLERLRRTSEKANSCAHTTADPMNLSLCKKCGERMPAQSE